MNFIFENFKILGKYRMDFVEPNHCTISGYGMYGSNHCIFLYDELADKCTVKVVDIHGFYEYVISGEKYLAAQKYWDGRCPSCGEIKTV